MISEVFVGDLDSSCRERGRTSRQKGHPYAPLPEITLTGLTPLSRRPLGGPEPISESRKYDGRIVLLGGYPGVETLALFLGLAWPVAGCSDVDPRRGISL
jgi:hypothetical protein